jgi:hypothetical protein
MCRFCGWHAIWVFAGAQTGNFKNKNMDGDLGLPLLPKTKDGHAAAGHHVHVFDNLADPPIEERGVSASFLRVFTKEFALGGARDCRVEKHRGHACGWCAECTAWVPFDASPHAKQGPCTHGRWPCPTGAHHDHGCHREVYTSSDTGHLRHHPTPLP